MNIAGLVTILIGERRTAGAQQPLRAGCLGGRLHGAAVHNFPIAASRDPIAAVRRLIPCRGGGGRNRLVARY